MTTDLGSRLLERIYHDHSLGKLAVPSLPEVVLRVQRALDVPNADSVAIAQVAQADSALASRLIRIANSPLYHGAAPVFDCERAITRIGLKKLRNLVTSLALREIFQAQSPRIAERL
jgi:HD-like signal output (HDOD) protein